MYDFHATTTTTTNNKLIIKRRQTYFVAVQCHCRLQIRLS